MAAGTSLLLPEKVPDVPPNVSDASCALLEESTAPPGPSSHLLKHAGASMVRGGGGSIVAVSSM